MVQRPLVKHKGNNTALSKRLGDQGVKQGSLTYLIQKYMFGQSSCIIQSNMHQLNKKMIFLVWFDIDISFTN